MLLCRYVLGRVCTTRNMEEGIEKRVKDVWRRRKRDRRHGEGWRWRKRKRRRVRRRMRRRKRRRRDEIGGEGCR